MKTALVAVRGRRAPAMGRDVGPLADALAAAGFAADKVFVLDGEDAHEFGQTVLECKNFFDAVLFSAAADKLPALRGRAAELLKTEGEGGVLEAAGKLFFFLPTGEEGAAAVYGEAVPRLQERFGRRGCSVLRAVGVPAARLEGLRSSLGEGIVCDVADDYGDVRVALSYAADTPQSRVDEAVQAAAAALEGYLYAIDDTPLCRRAVELLKLRKMRLSCAESFTGGNVAARIVSVPGASEVFYEGVVAYDNGSKARRLGVRGETLSRSGAVSDDTAYEMAVGLLNTGCCDVALATTGIAGPASDGTDKPVGLCYIAAGTREAVFVYKYILRGCREDITRQAVNRALFLLCKQIR